MFINITVNPRSRLEKVEQVSEKEYKLSFNVVPEKGRANQKVVEMLSDYFDCPKSNIEIKLGKSSREKVVEIKGL